MIQDQSSLRISSPRKRRIGQTLRELINKFVLTLSIDAERIHMDIANTLRVKFRISSLRYVRGLFEVGAWPNYFLFLILQLKFQTKII